MRPVAWSRIEVWFPEGELARVDAAVRAAAGELGAGPALIDLDDRTWSTAAGVLARASVYLPAPAALACAMLAAEVPAWPAVPEPGILEDEA